MTSLLARLTKFGTHPIRLPFLRLKLRPFSLVQYSVNLIIAYYLFRSSMAHLQNPYYFMASIYEYEIVPKEAGPFLAALLPILQLILAIALVGRILEGGSLVISSFILGMYALAQASAFVRGLSIECGCFGPATVSPVGSTSIFMVTSLWLAALACYVTWVRTQNCSSDDSEGSRNQ